MGDIQIKTARTKSEIDKFLKFAWEIYDGDPNWVPPLLFDKKKILNKKKNPFFEHADLEMFTAHRDGKMVGRIAAIRNDLHNEVHEDKVGFFGFFECINDQNVANVLFDTAKEWIQKQGLTSMRGPANPSSNDEYGLLTEGFDDPPRLLMTYNPKYYIDLITNYGFKKAKELYAYDIQNSKIITSDKLFRVADIATKRLGLKVRQVDMKKFKSELDKIKFVYNKAWEKNWGFVPMTEAEIDALAADLKPLVEPSLALFAEIEGKTVAFALAVLDYNAIFKEMNGRLLPFGFLKLFTQKKKIEWARIIILGVIPEYQRKGIDAVLYKYITENAAKLGIYQGEASWILEDNDMMNRSAEMMQGTIYKRYMLYEIPV